MKFARATLCVLSVVFSLVSHAQIPTPGYDSASPALVEHFFQEIRKWVEEPPSGALASQNLPATTVQALRDAEFAKTRTQLRQLGVKAWPMAPRVADLLVRATQKQYDLAWIVMDMAPPFDRGESTVSMIKAKLDDSTTLPAERLVLIAQLGRVQHPQSVKQLSASLVSAEASTRLMATVALGYAGRSDAPAAALLLASQLKDTDRFARLAAANAIRLIGRPAAAAAPALAEYLRTRENVYMACAALKDMPIEVIRPLKSELESVIADTKLNSFQKQDAINLLLRIEAESSPTGPLVTS